MSITIRSTSSLKLRVLDVCGYNIPNNRVIEPKEIFDEALILGSADDSADGIADTAMLAFMLAPFEERSLKVLERRKVKFSVSFDPRRDKAKWIKPYVNTPTYKRFAALRHLYQSIVTELETLYSEGMPMERASFLYVKLKYIRQLVYEHDFYLFYDLKNTKDGQQKDWYNHKTYLEYAHYSFNSLCRIATGYKKQLKAKYGNHDIWDHIESGAVAEIDEFVRWLDERLGLESCDFDAGGSGGSVSDASSVTRRDSVFSEVSEAVSVGSGSGAGAGAGAGSATVVMGCGAEELTKADQPADIQHDESLSN